MTSTTCVSTSRSTAGSLHPSSSSKRCRFVLVSMYVCMYCNVWLHVCMSRTKYLQYLYDCVHMNVWVYIFMHVFMYIFMYVSVVNVYEWTFLFRLCQTRCLPKTGFEDSASTVTEKSSSSNWIESQIGERKLMIIISLQHCLMHHYYYIGNILSRELLRIHNWLMYILHFCYGSLLSLIGISK